VDRITIKPYGKQKKVSKDDVIGKQKPLEDASRVQEMSSSALGHEAKEVKIHQI
jgi:hypothetical protein